METSYSRQLQGAFAKSDRASGLLVELHTAIESYLANSVSVGFEEMPDEGQVNLIIQKFSHPPLELSTRIGEIGHNLRSALNLLAHEMIKLNGATPSSRAEFPIFLSEAAFPKANNSKLRGLSPAQLKTMENLQPFKMEKPEDHALWGLHELNNADKHRVIVDCGRTLDGIDFRLAFPHDATFILPPAKEAYGEGLIVYEGKPLGTLADIQFPFDRACVDIRFRAQSLVFAPNSGPLSMRSVFESLVQMSRVVKGLVFVSPGCLDGF